MNQRKLEESGQNVLGFKCKEIINGEEKGAYVQNQGNAGSQGFEMKIAAPTPEKTSEPSRTKVKEGGIKHLEKWVTQCMLYFPVVKIILFEPDDRCVSLFSDIMPW